MLIGFSYLSVESDHHRRALVADADGYRLARLARSARRRGRGWRLPTRSPEPPARDRAAADRDEQTPAQRNDDAERRYAVSR
jgi:hypothetical protein